MWSDELGFQMSLYMSINIILGFSIKCSIYNYENNDQIFGFSKLYETPIVAFLRRFDDEEYNPD